VATITRYILIDGTNTAGGNGTTNTNSGADRAYAGVTEWEADEQGDLTVLSDVTVSSVSGTFEIGEQLDFSPSGAIGTLKFISGTDMTYEVLQATPTTADDISGNTSSATCDIDTIDATGGTHVVNCSGSTADTDFNVITGWTTTVTNFVTMNGEVSTTGGYDTSKFRVEHDVISNYDGCLKITSMDGMVYNDVQVEISNSGTSTTAAGLYWVDSDDVTANRCIMKGGDISTTGSLTMGIWTTGGTDFILRACLAYDVDGSVGNDDRGIYTTATANGGALVQNCTVIDCERGFATAANDTILENCMAQNADTNNSFQGTFETGTQYCLSDESGDAPGTNVVPFGSTIFEDEGADDFRLGSSDTVAFENGVSLSGTFNFDLLNNAMPTTWPVGCHDKAIAVGGGGVPSGMFLLGVG
jgi:hypothetical protein